MILVNKRRVPLVPIAAILFLISVANASAQETADKSSRPTIRVIAEAVVTVKPDRAEINVGVVTQAQTAQAATTQNAQKLDSVLADLRKLLGSTAQLKTINYALTPNYRYSRDGGQPTITGYTASNTVEVTTDDLGQLGKVIDAASQSGANNIQSLRFTLKDEQAARAQALREASLKAKGEAQAIASALGVTIVRVLHVEEAGAVARPVFQTGERMAVGTAGVAPTPVETGTLDIHATVTLTVEISQ
jgi:uncharacterized protein